MPFVQNIFCETLGILSCIFGSLISTINVLGFKAISRLTFFFSSFLYIFFPCAPFGLFITKRQVSFTEELVCIYYFKLFTFGSIIRALFEAVCKTKLLIGNADDGTANSQCFLRFLSMLTAISNIFSDDFFSYLS